MILKKVERYTYLLLLIVFGLMITINTIFKLNRETLLREHTWQNFEENSRVDIQEKYKLMKYIKYRLDHELGVLPVMKDPSLLLSTQKKIKENNYLLSSLNVDMDVLFLDKNSGISQTRSYKLDNYLNELGLEKEAIQGQKQAFLIAGKLFYFIPARAEGVSYLYRFNEGVMNSLSRGSGNWYIFIDDLAYDFTKEVPLDGVKKDLVLYDKDLELGFVFERERSPFKEFLIIIFFYFLCPFVILMIILPRLTPLIAAKINVPLTRLLKGFIGEDERVEVNHLSNYFSELKKQNKNLQNEVKYMENQVVSKVLKDYLYGLTPELALGNEGERFFEGRCQLAILKFDSEEFKEGLFVIRGFLEEKLNGSRVINIDNSIYVVIIDTGVSTYSKKELTKVLVEIYTDYDIEGYGFLSEKSYHQDELFNHYFELEKNLDYRFLLEENIIISETDIAGNKSKQYYYPIELEQKWLNKYTKGNFQGVKVIIDEIFKENFVIRKIDSKTYETLRILIFNSLKRLDSELVTTYKEEFFNVSDPFRLKDRLLHILRESKELANYRQQDTSQNTKKNNLEEQINHFIKENYQDDISLSDLAECLGVSLQYASNLHKKIKGETFNHYLNRYRVEKSIELLKENADIKVKDLAGLVGYVNIKTFITNFKKITGVSPGKYNRN